MSPLPSRSTMWRAPRFVWGHRGNSLPPLEFHFRLLCSAGHWHSGQWIEWTLLYFKSKKPCPFLSWWISFTAEKTEVNDCASGAKWAGWKELKLCHSLECNQWLATALLSSKDLSPPQKLRLTGKILGNVSVAHSTFKSVTNGTNKSWSALN